MPNLGSLYYELFLKDLTDQDLQAVEKKLKNLGIELDTKKLTESLKKSVESYKGKDLALGVKTQYLHDAIRSALKQPEFPIKVTVNKAEAQDAVREALRRAGLQQGFTASDKRQFDAETRRLAAMQVAQARAASANALAQQRLARAHNITESSVKKHTSATISLNSALKGNITLSRELGSAIGAAYSVVALKNFMTKVVEIGGELEQQKLAMKAILGDEGMANTISSQINTLAVKSPFGVMELNQYAKQLTAFQIPYNELYDTMKRMADVSAAVGVDMGRIILAYGQVRAAKFLKGTELRQFTEANIPLIDMLAERFTKLKGEIVSAGDIMDMVSNKEISFEDVKAVLWELTGEGGKFYNMQEVLSESVKAKWKNLADAIDLMFADIAKETSGPLKTTAEILTELTSKWELIATTVEAAALTFGGTKAVLLLFNRGLSNTTTNAIRTAESQALLERRNLRLAQSYRDLTAAERTALATPTKGVFSGLNPMSSLSGIKNLTDEQTKQLIVSKQISKEEWMRLVAMGKLTQRQKAALVVYGGISREELRSIRNLKRMQLLWAKIRFTAASVGRAIAGFVFNPATLITTGIAALTALWEKNNEEMRRAKELGQELETQGSEASKNLAEALNSMPKNASGVDATQTVETLQQLVKDYSSIPDKVLDLAQFKDDGTIRTTAEQIAYLRNELGKLKAANDALSEKGEDYGAVVKVTNGGLLDDDVITDINDWANAVDKAKGAYLKFVAEYKKDAEAIVATAAKEDAAYRESIEGMDKLIDKFSELMNNSEKYSKGFSASVEGNRWKLGGGLKGFLGISDGVLQSNMVLPAFYSEMVAEIQEAVNAFKELHADWDWSKLDSTQEEIARKYFNGLIQKAEDAGPEAQKQLQSIVSNILNFDISGNSGTLMIVNELQDALPRILGKGLANKVVNGLNLTEEERNTVDEAIRSTYEKLFADADKLGKEALKKAVFTNEDFDLTKLAGIRARFDITADWDSWKRELNQKFGGDPEIQAWIKAAPDYLSFTKAVQDGYNDAQTAIDKLKPVLVKAKLGFDFEAGELLPEGAPSTWYMGLDETQKKNVRDYNQFILKRKKAQNVGETEGFDPRAEYDKGKHKDPLAESLKQRFKDIKDAWSEFQKWSKTEGREAAATRIGESGLFSTLSADKIPQTVEQYRALVVELENELRKAGVKGTTREGLLNDLLKQLLDIDKAVVDEQLKLALDKVSKEAERQLADWSLFDKIRKTTGNQDLAMSVAFGMNADVNTDYPTMIKQQLQKTVDAAEAALSKVKPKKGESPYEVQGYNYDKLKELYDARDTEAGMQAWMAVPEEIRKAWEKANGDILKYFDQQRESVANILNEYQTLQDKINAINAKRNLALETINAKNERGEYILSDEERAKRSSVVNTQADYDIFTQSNDYLRFFNDIYGLTMDEANRIGDLIQLNLNRKLQDGLITIYDYEQQMEKVRKQLEALRNVKSDAMTFLTGGLKGLNQKKLQKAEGELANNADYQKALKEQIAAQNALNKAQEEGNEEAIEAAEAQLALANQSVQVFTKIRDAIIADQEKMQNVLDVANINANIAGGMSDAFNTLRDMADSFGFDTESNAWETAAAVMDTLTTVTSGVSKVVQSAMNGDIGGVISGTFDTLLTPFTIWNKLHDKKLQKDIELSKRRFNQYDRLVTAIERKLNDHLGGYVDFDPMPGTDYGKDGAFGYERDMKKAQLEELKRQQADMEAMKKKDPEAIEDIKAQISELTDEIANLEIEAANALYGIDIKGYAETIGDALWDAFMKGEDAAEAFDKAVADIMSNVVKNILKVNILERAFQRTKDWLASEDGPMNDGILTTEEAKKLGQMLYEDGKKGMKNWNTAMSAMPEELVEMWKAEYTNQKSGLSAGIQSVTEDTADLLASYLNGVRGDVSMQTHDLWPRLLDDALPQISVIAQSQLDAQRQIAENTLRNAVAAEAIQASTARLVELNDQMGRSWRRIAERNWGYS